MTVKRSEALIETKMHANLKFRYHTTHSARFRRALRRVVANDRSERILQQYLLNVEQSCVYERLKIIVRLQLVHCIAVIAGV